MLRISTMILTAAIASGCSIAPSVNVNLIDRHTVMESEAAGEWPMIDQRLRQSLNKGPIALREVNDTARQERALRVLNGEFPANAASGS